VVVLGYIVRGPVGGLSWHHLQYVMGLAELGHDVRFVEDSDDYPSCYDPSAHATGTDPSYGLDFIAQVMDWAGLGERWAYHDAHRGLWHGPAAGHIVAFCRSADIVLNLSAINPLRPWLEAVPVRVLVDTDPVFTQVRHLTDDPARRRAAGHTAFFSFAENIPGGRSAVPDDGFPWRATRQPIVLSAWPVTPGPQAGRFTTVMQWQSYPARTYGGRSYGAKDRSFSAVADLPSRVGPVLELAISGGPEEALREENWGVRHALEVSRWPWTYRRYIQESKAEFSVAKHAYVVTRSGWFSERSACYLASGRPVVTEDTGFHGWMSSDAGVLAYASVEEAAAAVEDVIARYEVHCEAARAVAETRFDSRRVLAELLEESLVPV
jgi:hypothetical protein